MGDGEVGFGEAGVGFDHVQGLVAEEVLEGAGVAAVAEEEHGEGVPETVRVDVGDAGALAEAGEEVDQGVTVDRAAVGDEERLVDGYVSAFGADVAEDEFGGAGADRDHASFAALAGDGDALVAEIGVDDAEAAELGGAHAGVEQDEDETAVAQCGAAGALLDALAGALVGFGLVAGGEQSLDVVLAVGDDGGLFGPRPLDVVQDVAGGVAFADGPGPECRQAGVDVEGLLFADGADPAVDDGRGGGQAGEETAHVVGGDGGEVGIRNRMGRIYRIDGDVILEFPERVLIVGEGVRAEAARTCVELVAEYCLG